MLLSGSDHGHEGLELLARSQSYCSLQRVPHGEPETFKICFSKVYVYINHGMTNLISTHKTEAEWLNQFMLLQSSNYPQKFFPLAEPLERKYYPETLALLSCTKCIGSICVTARSGRKGRGVCILKDFFTLFWGDNSFPCSTCTIQCLIWWCSRNTRVQFFLNTPPIFMAIWRLIKDWIDPVPWSFDVWCKHVPHTFLHRSGDLDSQQDVLWFPSSECFVALDWLARWRLTRCIFSEVTIKVNFWSIELSFDASRAYNGREVSSSYNNPTNFAVSISGGKYKSKGTHRCVCVCVMPMVSGSWGISIQISYLLSMVAPTPLMVGASKKQHETAVVIGFLKVAGTVLELLDDRL